MLGVRLLPGPYQREATLAATATAFLGWLVAYSLIALWYRRLSLVGCMSGHPPTASCLVFAAGDVSTAYSLAETRSTSPASWFRSALPHC